MIAAVGRGNDKLKSITGSKTTPPRRFANGAFAAAGWLIGEGDDIVESLMVALVLMVRKIFIARVVQGTFAEENQFVESLFSAFEIPYNRIKILLPPLLLRPVRG